MPRWRGLGWLGGALVWAAVASAEAPATSPRPEGRPDSQQAAPAPATEPQVEAPATPAQSGSRPRGRPDAAATAATPAPETAPELTPAPASVPDVPATVTASAVARSPRPAARPGVITARAVETRLAEVRGQVCGDPAIQGQALGAVNGPGRCGVEDAVKLRAVAGVSLSPNPTMDCRTAGALKAWVAQAVKPSVGTAGGGVTGLRIGSDYACRNRNNASGGRLSEHAFGRAVDIMAIELADGSEISVLRDWGRGRAGDALKQMWRAACGPFGTVLGPEANAAHRDHFHFDTARYRNGSYCR